MRNLFAITFALAIAISAQARQKSGADSVVTEARKLYAVQVAGIYGREVLHQQFGSVEDKAGGSFSYPDNGHIKCVFYSNGEKPVIIATVDFASVHELSKSTVDTVVRPLNRQEQDLYIVSKQTEEQLAVNNLFKKCKNTRWNIVPLTDSGNKRVYVFTTSKISGMVVFGNDYLLSFNDNNQLTGTQSLHKDMIPLNYRQDNDSEPITTVHNHNGSTTDFTATDICTVMLYEKCANWKNHMVISKSKVSIWNCEKDELVTMSLKDWEKHNP